MDEKLRKKTLLALFFVILVDNMSFSLTFTLFPPIFIDSSYHLVTQTMSDSVKNLLLGVVFIVFPLAQFFGAPVLGDYADINGRKKALMISVSGVSIGVILSAIALSLNSITVLVFSRLFTGFFSGNLSISLAGISDLSVTEKERGKNFGYAAALMGAGWIFAMVLGGVFSTQYLFSYYGPMIAFWFIAGLSLINLLIVYLYVTESYKVSKFHHIDVLGGLRNIYNALKLKEVKGYFLIYFLWVCGWGGALQWFGSYAISTFQEKPFMISIAFILNGTLWTLGGSIINAKAVKLFTSYTLSWLSYIVIAPLVFSMGIYPNFYLFSIPLIAGAIFGALSMTHSLNLISLNASESIQGKIMGLSQSVQAIGWIFTSILAVIFFSFAPNIYFYIIGILLLFAFLLLLLFNVKKSFTKKRR